MRILVIGGGITGQLVKMVVPSARVLDWRVPGPNVPIPRLTRQYGANYLWEPIDRLECRPIHVLTHVDGQTATWDAVKRYKTKIGKDHEVVGVVPTDPLPEQFCEHQTGYEIIGIPPTPIEYGMRVSRIFPAERCLEIRGLRSHTLEYDVLVSTIPLYSLLSLARMSTPMPLRHTPIWVHVGRCPPDSPATLAGTDMYVNYLTTDVAPYRVTDRSGERHYESLSPMANVSHKRLIPGKILPSIDVPGVLDQLVQHDIWCFGRYGRWSSDELVHQTYQYIVQWANALGLK